MAKKKNNLEIEITGDASFQRALERNPRIIIAEIKDFTQRALAKYRAGIMRNPWRIGMAGGGAPVATGNLRDTHRSDTFNMGGRIYPTADQYSGVVHKNRPWLNFVFKDKRPEIDKLQTELLERITKDLAK